jgi:hypothetical protein
VTDFVRECTLIRQELQDPHEGNRGRFAGLVARFASQVMTGDFFFVDGTVYVRDRDEGFTTRGDPLRDGPRHPNDPAWIVDVLYGVRPPVEQVVEPPEPSEVELYLAAIADLEAADRLSPHGILPPVAARGSDRREMRLHVWLNAEHLPLRISIEQRSAMPPDETFWSAVEFWDYGIDVDQEWDPEVARVLTRDK